MIPILRAMAASVLGLAVMAAADKPAPTPNGIDLPENYKDWRVIAPSHRTDNETIRVIVGNDAAIEAARAGETNPWPDGAVLGKLVWRDAQHAEWETATVPGDFILAEFMVKNATKFGDTGGWGYARWIGLDQKPYGEDADFVQECYSCHIPVKDRDYVFTKPVSLP